MTFLDNASRGVGQAFGFHLKPIHVTRLQGQPDPHLFLNDLTRQGWRLIHLQRRDLVAQVFSVIYAAHAGRYHFTNDRRDEDRPLAIKPKRFVRKLRAWNDMRELEQRAIRGLDAIDLSYEGDLVDPVRRDKALARIVASLGLPPAPMSSSLRKSVRRPVWEMIANADEVRDAMVAAGFDPETGRRLNPEPDLAPQMFRR
ncbi:hypothetical protein [Oceaniovalibus guishaninsula]|nr:hypothetical protein [Oceaniovalibus guishaninsula]